jgi:hypothetical protein
VFVGATSVMSEPDIPRLAAGRKSNVSAEVALPVANEAAAVVGWREATDARGPDFVCRPDRLGGVVTNVGLREGLSDSRPPKTQECR